MSSEAYLLVDLRLNSCELLVHNFVLHLVFLAEQSILFDCLPNQHIDAKNLVYFCMFAQHTLNFPLFVPIIYIHVVQSFFYLSVVCQQL